MEDHDDEQHARRREQVRKAQKTHRARKAVYVKQLEAEVKDLRKQNAVNLSVIRHLRELLRINGVPIPADVAQAKESDDLTTVTLTGNSLRKQMIQAQTRPFNSSRRTYGGTNPAGSAEQPEDVIAERSIPRSLPNPNITLIYNSQGQTYDATQVAINFVLALEQPCIHHHKTPSPELLMTGSVGNGHHNMLSSPVMTRAPSFSLNPLSIGYKSGTQWDVPTQELEKLLSYANDLPLGTEVTPIQMWQVIVASPKFARVSFEQLEILGRTLFPMVNCYGFGAVVDQAFFEQVVQQMFSAL